MNLRVLFSVLWRMSWGFWFWLQWICRLLLVGRSSSQHSFCQSVGVGGVFLSLLKDVTFSLQRSFTSWRGAITSENIPLYTCLLLVFVVDLLFFFKTYHFAEYVDHFQKFSGEILGVSYILDIKANNRQMGPHKTIQQRKQSADWRGPRPEWERIFASWQRVNIQNL